MKRGHQEAFSTLCQPHQTITGNDMDIEKLFTKFNGIAEIISSYLFTEDILRSSFTCQTLLTVLTKVATVNISGSVSLVYKLLSSNREYWKIKSLHIYFDTASYFDKLLKFKDKLKCVKDLVVNFDFIDIIYSIDNLNSLKVYIENEEYSILDNNSSDSEYDSDNNILKNKRNFRNLTKLSFYIIKCGQFSLSKKRIHFFKEMFKLKILYVTGGCDCDIESINCRAFKIEELLCFNKYKYLIELQLRSINLEENQIFNLPNLKTVVFYRVRAKNIKFYNSYNLQVLSVKQAIDLKQLLVEKVNNLIAIDFISNTLLKNLFSLKNANKLQTITLTDCSKIKSIETIKYAKNLCSFVYKNGHPDISDMSFLENLTCLFSINITLKDNKPITKFPKFILEKRKKGRLLLKANLGNNKKYNAFTF